MTFGLFEVDRNYVAKLYRDVDNHVLYHHGDHDRPYVGVIVQRNGFNYFIPMSSPKPKHEHLSLSKSWKTIPVRNGKRLVTVR